MQKPVTAWHNGWTAGNVHFKPLADNFQVIFACWGNFTHYQPRWLIQIAWYWLHYGRRSMTVHCFSAHFTPLPPPPPLSSMPFLLATASTLWRAINRGLWAALGMKQAFLLNLKLFKNSGNSESKGKLRQALSSTLYLKHQVLNLWEYNQRVQNST